MVKSSPYHPPLLLRIYDKSENRLPEVMYGFNKSESKPELAGQLDGRKGLRHPGRRVTPLNR